MTSVAEPGPVAPAAPHDAPASVVSAAPHTTKTPVAELPEPPPVQHPPGSLAEALARAAAMPKAKAAAAEPKKPIVNPYADIEMPDGDWG